MAEEEAVMEQRLIAQLTTGVSQWTYRPDITTEAALWANLRQKLNQNNVAALDGVAPPISWAPVITKAVWVVRE